MGSCSCSRRSPSRGSPTASCARASSRRATFIWACFMALTGAVNNAFAMAIVARGRGLRRVGAHPDLAVADRRPVPDRRAHADVRDGEPRSADRARDRTVHRRRGGGMGRRRRGLAVGDGRGRGARGGGGDRARSSSASPSRGRNEQEAVLGKLLDDSEDPPVRLSSAAARLRKVKSFRYLILGIGVLGFALVSVPARLSFLFDEIYGFSAYKRGWVLSLTYLPALLVIPIAGRYGDRLFRQRSRATRYGCSACSSSRTGCSSPSARSSRPVEPLIVLRGDRQRVPARGVHAGGPDHLRGGALPDAIAGVRADRLLHLPPGWLLRRPGGRGDRRRLRRAHRAARRRARGRARRRTARDERAAGS